MPRLRQVPRAEAAPSVLPLYQLLFGDRDPVAEPGTATGSPGDWWPVFALVPDVFDHSVGGFALYQSPKRLLDPQLRELGQTRVGFTVGSRFVFSQHCKSCRTAGIDEEKIAGDPALVGRRLLLADRTRGARVRRRARLRPGPRPRRRVRRAARQALSDEEILELTYITSLYAMHGVMSKALRTEFDDVDEPMVEIPAPGDDQTFHV